MVISVFARFFALLCLGGVVSGAPQSNLAVTGSKLKILSLTGEDKAVVEGKKIAGLSSLDDNQLVQEERDCYTSKTKGGWVEAKIPFAEVTQIRFVPGSSGSQGAYSDYPSDYESGESYVWPAESAMVYVCKQGTDNCQKCGAAQSVKAGKWAVSHCPTGIKGDSVKITQAGAQNLQLCEVEVHGTGLVGKIHVDTISGTKTRDYTSKDWSFGDMSTLVNGELKEPNFTFCYQAELQQPDPWVEAKIPHSSVASVQLFPYHYYPIEDHVQKVNFYKVEVCKGSSSCVTCGALPDVPNDKWSTSECPQNAEGDTIKITITRKGSLRFCELQINGKVLG